MSAPIISNIATVQQGQGQYYLPKQSVIEIEVSFSTTGNIAANFLVELSLDSGTTWATTTLHAQANGQNVIPPTYSYQTAMILIDVTQTWNNLSLTPGVYTNCKVRLTATASSVSSTPYVNAATFSIKSTRPVITLLSMPNWVGQSQAYIAPVTITATDDTGGGQAAVADFTHLIRQSMLASDLGPGTTTSFATFAYSSSPNATSNIATAPTGAVTIYFKIYDQFYNASDIASVTTNLQLTSPNNCIIQLTGTQGNKDYTGITINSDGSFTPNRAVTVNVSCTSTTPGIPLSFQILSSSNVERTSNVGVLYTLNPTNAQQTLNLTTNVNNPTQDNFNADALCTVSVKFIDAANNFTVVNQTIRLNTRIYNTAFKPLRHEAGNYAPRLHFISSGGVDTSVPATMIMSTNPIRTWNEIFYPTTHAYPLDVNGNPDTAFINADPNLKAMIPTSTYDPILISVDTTQIPNVITPILDEEGRPITTNWTRDGSKNYLNLESTSLSSVRYWIINNTGYGDFQLEFEYFDLDTNIFGPPYNTMSPYGGDVLMVYDATTSGALSLITGPNGAPTLALANSTLLKPLFAFAGSADEIYDFMQGTSVGSTAQGQFVTSTISNIPLIVLMLFTDAAGTKSGFKVKSSPRHDRIFTNFDVDEVNGQVWVHLHESLSDTQQRGSADNTVKHFYYDYVPNVVSIDVEAGVATFTTPQLQGVTADYSYYISDTPQSNNFIAGSDDFVYYDDAPVYIVPTGQVVCTPAQKLALYQVNGYGRMVGNYAWDKDRGVVTITPSGVAPSGVEPIGQRLTTDYFCHTYMRLTSDQYGDLVFRDKVLVADQVPNFPDYTWADVKIVNEGNVTLKDMQVTFVPRGYDTNGDGQVILTGTGVVDQVLDINRPWDIQMGTKDETYTKMAMAIAASYIWPRNCPRLGGDGLAGSSGAGSIFSTWSNKVYGDLASRTTVFGRVVWILGGSSGSSYPTAITAGTKRASLELMGKYYASLVI